VPRVAEQDAGTDVIDTIGLVCARASLVALGGGLVEGLFMTRALDGAAAGLPLANAGLWFPLGLLALLPARPIAKRLDNPIARPRLIALGGALLFLAAVFGLLGARLGLGPIRWAPVEILAALELAVVASVLRPEPPLRRILAIAGLVLAFGLQLFATRWIDAHAAFAGATTQLAWVPRVMLKFVLRRFV
jgi:hypothetical protein